MQYKILKAYSYSGNSWSGHQVLANEVEKLLNEGWFLQGNIVVEGGFLYQAMTKPDDKGQ